MMRRTLMIAALALAPGVAIAAGAEAPSKDAGQFVDLLPVALPIVAEGRLVNYVFVHVRINLTPRALAGQLRMKEPEFRDALVRAGHRTPFTVDGDYSKVDTARLAAALMREGAVIAGPGQLKSVVITSQQPRRRVAAPRA